MSPHEAVALAYRDRRRQVRFAAMLFRSMGFRLDRTRLDRLAMGIGFYGGEWHAADILEAFDGNGVVRVLDRFDGAVLLERLQPGKSLVGMAVDGDDDRATGILAGVIGRMSPRAPASLPSTVQAWGRAFEGRAACGDSRIPKPLLEAGRSNWRRG